MGHDVLFSGEGFRVCTWLVLVGHEAGHPEIGWIHDCYRAAGHRDGELAGHYCMACAAALGRGQAPSEEPLGAVGAGSETR